ncbi:unnamed protein product, partial [marine sediment metagenome]
MIVGDPFAAFRPSYGNLVPGETYTLSFEIDGGDHVIRRLLTQTRIKMALKKERLKVLSSYWPSDTMLDVVVQVDEDVRVQEAGWAGATVFVAVAGAAASSVFLTLGYASGPLVKVVQHGVEAIEEAGPVAKFGIGIGLVALATAAAWFIFKRA